MRGLLIQDFAGPSNPYNPHILTQSEGSSRQTSRTGATSSNYSNTRTGSRIPPTLLVPASTPSNQRRGTTPEILDKSIGHFRLGHGAPVMFINRFQKGSAGPNSAEPHKPLLARLHLTFAKGVKLPPKGFDGSGSEEEPAVAPLPKSHLFVRDAGSLGSRAGEERKITINVPLAPVAFSCEGSSAELWEASYARRGPSPQLRRIQAQ